VRTICPPDGYQAAHDCRGLSVSIRALNLKKSVLSRAASVLTLGWSDSSHGRLSLRRAVSNIVRLEMRLRSTRLSLGALNTVLVVAPHPDDESFGCGGTLAQLAKKGASLHIAFITDGRASHPFHSAVTPKEIAKRRKEEAICASNILGIGTGNLTFMDAPDGELTMLEREDPKSIVEGIALLLARVKPDAVLLPCRSDGSSEHDAAFRLVRRAIDKSGRDPRIVEFPIWSWWNPLLLLKANFDYRKVWRVELGDVLPLKARAIASYRSQTFPIPPDTAPALPPGFASMFQDGDEFLLEK